MKRRVPFEGRPLRAGSTLSTTARSLFRDRADVTYLTLLSVLGAYVYYVGLGSYHLQTWDEAIYANAARNMVQRGYWLVPHLDWLSEPDAGFQPFLEKPPLMMWLQAAAMLVFGITEFAARVPSATASVLTGVLVYVMGRTYFDRRAGALGGIVFLTTPLVYAGFDAGRTGGTDMLHVFLGSLFVFLAHRIATGDDARYGLLGLLAGLTVLVKGFAAGVFLVVLLPTMVGTRRRFLGRDSLGTVATTALVVLPWTLLAWLRYGDRFVDQIFIEQVLLRVGGQYPVKGAVLGFMNFPYLRNQFVAFDPWVYFVLPAAAVVTVRSIADRDAERRRAVRFLIWWAVAVFVFFSLTGNHAWYVLPMYVPCAVLLGSLFSRAVGGDPLARGATAASLVATLGLAYRARGIGPGLAAEFAFDWSLPGAVVEGAPYLLALSFGGFVVLLSDDLVAFSEWALKSKSRASVGKPVLTAVAAAVFVFCLILTPPVTAGGYDDGWAADQKALGTTIDRELPADATIAFTDGAVTFPGLHALPFYAQRTFTPATVADLNGGSVEYALVTPPEIESIDREFTRIGEMSGYAEGNDLHVVLVRFQRPGSSGDVEPFSRSRRTSVDPPPAGSRSTSPMGSGPTSRRPIPHQR